MSNKDWGGKRNKAGRKPVSYEKEVREAIEKALGEKDMTEIWSNLIKAANDGEIAAINTLLNYYYGKPKESKDNNLSGEIKITIVEP